MSDSFGDDDDDDDRLLAAIAAARARRLLRQNTAETTSGFTNMADGPPGENRPGESRPDYVMPGESAEGGTLSGDSRPRNSLPSDNLPTERDPDEVTSFSTLWQSTSGDDDAAVNTTTAYLDRLETGEFIRELLADLDSEQSGPTNTAADTEADTWLWLTAQEDRHADDEMSVPDDHGVEIKVGQRDEAYRLDIEGDGETVWQEGGAQENGQIRVADDDTKLLEKEYPVRTVVFEFAQKLMSSVNSHKPVKNLQIKHGNTLITNNI